MSKDLSSPDSPKLNASLSNIPNINNNTILQRNNFGIENQGIGKYTQTSCENLELAFKNQEEFLRKEIEETFNLEIAQLTERFDYILLNEQMRCSFMLRQAYREREEKITALQTQLECKNLAGLMYVLCTERRKAQLERLNITDEYTKRIHELQAILTEGQSLILYLSRGYKTAAKVDHEWREKMKKVLFHSFIQDFCNGTKEDIQHLFDLPTLLNVKTPVEPDPNDDPCEPEDVDPNKSAAEPELEKQWWEKLDNDPSPFVVYGDLGDMKPNHRREVLRNVKAAKTAPTKWKDYVFNEMYLNADCSNIDDLKNEFKKQNLLRLEAGVQTQEINSYQSSLFSHRMTATNMGSILKIITAPLDPTQANEATKSTILGARDSMEIASTSKLLKVKSGDRHSETHPEKNQKLSIGNRRNSILKELAAQRQRQESVRPICETEPPKNEDEDEEMSTDDVKSLLGSIVHDSMILIPDHVPDKDAKIQYEKVCPMEECQHLQVDSFIKTLPPYMRASPFQHFNQTFEEYEPCSPEQLKILKERIELSKLKSSVAPLKEDLLAEWTPVADGIATQTSIDNLLECTCGMSAKSKESVVNQVFSLKNLMPLKATLDTIKKECLFDDKIEFNRFKVVGEEDSSRKAILENKKDFKNRLDEIQKVLKQHPSLCKLFQANTSC